MKIFAISDLHLSTTGDKPMDIFGANWSGYVDRIIADWEEKVSDDDIVLIAGDISWAMSLENALLDLEQFSKLKGKKIIIRGNHDYWWKSLSKIRANIYDNFYVLQNDCVKIGNVIICGSRGWTVEGSNDFTQEDKKLYLRENERLRLALNAVKKVREDGDKVIAMIHFPPFNVKREDSLYTQMFKENSVDAVVYGHLHGKDCKADRVLVKDGIPYYLSSCDLVGNKLIEIVL